MTSTWLHYAIWIALPLTASAFTGATAAIDPQGNVIIGLTTMSTIPGIGCTPLPSEGFCGITTYNFEVRKYSPDGTKKAWDSQLNGTGTGLAVGPDGSVYVTGSFALPAGSPSSATSVLALDSKTGSTRNTFALDGDATQLLVDEQGDVIVCGSFPGSSLPLPAPVAGLANRGRPYCAWLDFALTHVVSAVAIGGSQGETLAAAALDPVGNLFTAGTTMSIPRSATITKGIPYTPFPVTPGALDIAAGSQNAFLTKFDSARNRQYSAVLGSSGADAVLSLAADAAGNAYLSGIPGSADFPTLDAQGLPSNSGVFAVKVSPDGSHLLYSEGVAITPAVALSSVDSNGSLYLVVPDSTSVVSLPPGSATTFQFESFVPTVDAATICATSPAYTYRAALIELAPDGSVALSSYLPYPNPTPLLVDSTGKVYVFGRSLPFDIFDPKSLAIATSLCVVNAADTVDGPLIPGELIAVHGINIGPSQPASFQLTNGLVPSQLAGVTLLINGIAAPLLYVSENQINAVVPFEIPEVFGQVSLQVVNNGMSLNTLTYASTGNPEQTVAIFTHGNTYNGQAYAFNPDGTLNGPNNPASAGSSLTLLTTGNGIGTNGQLPVDGSLGTGQPLALPNTFGAVGLLGNEQFPVTSIADDPGVVEGLVKVTVTVPQDAGTGQLMLLPNGYIYVH